MQLKCQVDFYKWEKNIDLKKNLLLMKDFCTLDVFDLKPLKILL